MRVYPAPGLLVRDPDKKDLLPADGREVDENEMFWCRLLNDGDVVIAAPEPTSAPTELSKPTRPATSTITRSNDE